MAAGESAYDVARRKREKAARLQRSADNWERRAVGEVEVARALDALPEGWIALHDLAWPGRTRANIDHVVVGPGGVFVVDAKNWSGKLELKDQTLVHNGRRREQTISSASEAAIAVKGVLPVDAPCTGALCFVTADPLAGWAGDVIVASTANVAAMLISRPRVLSAIDSLACVEVLSRGVRATVPRSSRAVRNASWRAAASHAPRGGRSKRVPARKLVAGVALLILAFSGALPAAGNWAAEQWAEQVAPSDPVQPPPPAKKNQTGKKAKKQEAQRG